MESTSQRRPEWLLDHSRNDYSQYGEDGIVQKILETLPGRDRWAVEFGAWDGKHFSNSRRLILDDGYQAVLVEANPEKYKECVETYRDNAGVHIFNQFVGYTAEDNLDHILAKTPIPKNFDFLCIDIDGNDYHIWKAFEDYKPKVVSIEHNPTMALDVDYAQPADPFSNIGASLTALAKLGKEKGYELVSVTIVNAIFVDAQYFSLFGIGDNSPAALRRDHSHVTHVFFGQDGSVHVAGNGQAVWHSLPLREKNIQILPKGLRVFPDNYTPFQRFLFKVWKKLPSVIRRALSGY